VNVAVRSAVKSDSYEAPHYEIFSSLAQHPGLKHPKSLPFPSRQRLVYYLQ